MSDNVHDSDSPSTEVTLAGVRFRSPVGLAPIGGASHFGRQDPDQEREHEIGLKFMLDHVRSGSSFLYLNFSYLTAATLRKLFDAADRDGTVPSPAGQTERFMRAETPSAPFGAEGLYSTVSPGPGVPDLQRETALLASQRKLVGALKERKP